MTAEQIARRCARYRVANMTAEQAERKRESNRVANMTTEQIETQRKRGRKNAKRAIRMYAGGVRFRIGVAPTVEVANYLRKKIKEEVPK